MAVFSMPLYMVLPSLYVSNYPLLFLVRAPTILDYACYVAVVVSDSL